MRRILEDRDHYILRFDAGDDVIAGIRSFCAEEEIPVAFFSAIGSAGEVILSYYNLETKEYEDKKIAEQLEITSLTGNVGTLDNTLVVHAHGTFSDRNMNVTGGHVKHLIVSATCEVALTHLDGTIIRATDSETGLNLMQ